MTSAHEEDDGWERADPRRHLDSALLCLADGILLCSIAATTVGLAVAVAAAAVAAESLMTATMLMPTIYVGALFIGREEREGDDGNGVATEDNGAAKAEAGEYAHNFLEVALSRLWEGHLAGVRQRQR